MQQIDYGVFEIPLKLPSQLEMQRASYESQIKSAQRRVVAFARKHDWGDLVTEPFAREAEIFVHQSHFVDALKKQHGVEVDKRKLELKEPIKALGNYEVHVKIYPEVIAKLQVNVVAL